MRTTCCAEAVATLNTTTHNAMKMFGPYLIKLFLAGKTKDGKVSRFSKLIERGH
jgi:hypothetical protein